MRVTYFSIKACVAAISLVALLNCTNTFAAAIETGESNSEKYLSNLGTIKGIVQDNAGKPIADATVAIFKIGTTRLLKQVRSAKDGSFVTRILPGRYSILAVAEGFNPVSLAVVEVDRASLANYGFRLERSGGGNTLPEKRLDRNNPKWDIRAAQISRSIYQIEEDGEASFNVGEAVETPNAIDKTPKSGEPIVSYAETFAASTSEGPFAGINYATLIPLKEQTQLILSAQAGIGRNAPQRFEVQLNTPLGEDHLLRVRGGFSKLGDIVSGGSRESLGQFSFQATDEWRVREGIILVYGVDYAKFVGAGGDFAISPRLGLQFDVDHRTRFRSSYTTLNEDRTWSKAIELENAQVIFREPASISDTVVTNNKPVMNRSSRLELGVERILDSRTNVEINGFFDTVFARGVGFSNFVSSGPLAGEVNEFVGNQSGSTRGVRAVISRRFNGILSGSSGYSFGSGQKVSFEQGSDPATLFESDLFHTLFGQVNVDLSTGTSVRTVFRLSSKAAVFAIDPFHGRLAIYDPGLSVLVTQSLPTLGLPLKAEASLDARNILDQQTGSMTDEGSIILNSHRRMLRGSILFRF